METMKRVYIAILGHLQASADFYTIYSLFKGVEFSYGNKCLIMIRGRIKSWPFHNYLQCGSLQQVLHTLQARSQGGFGGFVRTPLKLRLYAASASVAPAPCTRDFVHKPAPCVWA